MAKETNSTLDKLGNYDSTSCPRYNPTICLFKRKVSLRQLACHAFAIALGLTGAYLTYLLLDRGPVLNVWDFKTVPYDIGGGEHFTLSWMLNELRQGCAGEVYHYVVTNAGTGAKRIFYYVPQITAYHEALDPKEAILYTKDLIMPQGPPGESAEFHSHVTRWCNFMQKYIWPMTQDFSTPFKYK